MAIEITITPNPFYVPLYHQPTYKVAQILMILEYTTDGKREASVAHLHTVAWAMRDKEYFDILMKYISRKREKLVSWCYEPFLQKALIIALVEGYCVRTEKGNIKLTTKYKSKELFSGLDIIQFIEVNYLFYEQRSVLSRIGNELEIYKTKLSSKQDWEMDI